MRATRIPTKIACKITEICNFDDWGYMTPITIEKLHTIQYLFNNKHKDCYKEMLLISAYRHDSCHL